MIVREELTLGLLLVASAFLLVLALESYRRSGARVLLWLSAALSAHVAATLLLVVALLMNDSIDDATRLYMVVADGAALASILLLGLVGGRRGG